MLHDNFCVRVDHDQKVHWPQLTDEWHVLTDKLDAPISSGERRKVAKLLAETPMWTP